MGQIGLVAQGQQRQHPCRRFLTGKPLGQLGALPGRVPAKTSRWAPCSDITWVSASVSAVTSASVSAPGPPVRTSQRPVSLARFGFAQRCPGHPVAPRVDDRAVPLSVPPAGEGWQHPACGGIVQAQLAGQAGSVALLDRGPESGVRPVLSDGGRLDRSGVEPEPLPGEGIGGRVEGSAGRRCRRTAPATAPACPAHRRRPAPAAARPECPPRHQVPSTAVSVLSCAAVSSTPTVSTGCGLISMKCRNPSASNRVTVCSNRTLWRRLSYQ